MKAVTIKIIDDKNKDGGLIYTVKEKTICKIDTTFTENNYIELEIVSIINDEILTFSEFCKKLIIFKLPNKKILQTMTKHISNNYELSYESAYIDAKNFLIQCDLIQQEKHFPLKFFHFYHAKSTFGFMQFSPDMPDDIIQKQLYQLFLKAMAWEK